MKVYLVKKYEEYYGYEIDKIFSTLDKAKDYIRPEVEEFVKEIDEDAAEEILEYFEKYGEVDEWIKIEEWEVD